MLLHILESIYKFLMFVLSLPQRLQLNLVLHIIEIKYTLKQKLLK